MESLENVLIETVIDEAVARGDCEANEVDFAELIEEHGPAFMETAAATILDHVKKDAKIGLRRTRRERQGFEKRLGKHWAKPLHLLELTVELAQEVGAEINDESSAGGESSPEHTFNALVAIHARACQMSCAILALLRSGFADDAHARWRSLHELAVVSSFISQHGEDVAERYLLHEIVQQQKLARAYQKHEIRAGLEPLTQAEIDELDQRYASLVARFGKPFRSDYGWAASVLENEQPTFVHIEEDVQLDHLRPYYQMASQNVHGNSHAAFYKLGVDGTGRGVFLAGPSNLGLADPGHGVALSLTQITAALVDVKPTVDSLIMGMVLNLLQEQTGEAFLRAHEKAENIAEGERRKQSGHRRMLNRRRSGYRVLSGMRDQIVGLWSKLVFTG